MAQARVASIIKDALADFFASGWDAILSPLGPVPAFPHQQEAILTERIIDVDNENWRYLHLLDWISVATALHAPALSVPAGRTPAGLPVGVQIDRAVERRGPAVRFRAPPSRKGLADLRRPRFDAPLTICQS